MVIERIQTTPSPKAYVPCTKDELLARFPPKELYRFFMDGVKQPQGWKRFEKREPGYLKGMLDAFFIELNHLDEPLSPEVLVRIHKNAINGVKLEGDIKDEFRAPGRLVGFNVHLGRNLSHDGYDELKQLERHGVISVVEHGFKVDEKDRKTLKLVGYEGNVFEKVQEVLADFNTKLQSAVTVEDKVALIVRTLSQIERIHPFDDANCRTICMIALYRELLRQGLMPPILNDPNEFDGFSEAELCQRIKDGMARTQALMNNQPIEQRFVLGMIAPTADPSQVLLPADVIDLSKIHAYRHLEAELPPRYDKIEFEAEDALVYKMILMESIHRNLEVDALKEAPFFEGYKEQLDQLANDIINNDEEAQNKLKEAIEFGCEQAVSYILRKLKQADISFEFIDLYVVDCYKKARENHRDEAEMKFKTLVTDTVFHSLENKQFANLSSFLKTLYHSDPQLYEHVIDYIENCPNVDKPDISTITSIIEAAKRASQVIQGEISKIEASLASPKSSRPNLFSRWKLSNELSDLQRSLTEVEAHKTHLLKAVNSDQPQLVKELVKRALAKEGADEKSIYSHYRQLKQSHKAPRV